MRPLFTSHINKEFFFSWICNIFSETLTEKISNCNIRMKFSKDDVNLWLKIYYEYYSLTNMFQFQTHSTVEINRPYNLRKYFWMLLLQLKRFPRKMLHFSNLLILVLFLSALRSSQNHSHPFKWQKSHKKQRKRRITKYWHRVFFFCVIKQSIFYVYLYT